MKAITAMNKRGVTASGYAQTSSRDGGNSSPSSAFSNRKNSPSGVATVATRGNESNVSSKFYSGRGGKEYTSTVDSGDGHCKK